MAAAEEFNQWLDRKRATLMLLLKPINKYEATVLSSVIKFNSRALFTLSSFFHHRDLLVRDDKEHFSNSNIRVVLFSAVC